jgi:simple sugar transport system ATP-binding protein
MGVPKISSEVILRTKSISKRFGTTQANDSVSFILKSGEILALLGENGAGKTTLMNVLFGHYVADSGSVEVDGKPLPMGSPQASLNAGLGMVHQHFALADNLSVLDNIMIGTESMFSAWTNRREAQRKLEKLAGSFGLQIDPGAMIRDLSVGEKQRVEILKALYREARILILDEPTAVLIPQAIEQLFGTLKKLVQRGLSVLFISHKLKEVLAISDRIMVLRQGRMVAERITSETDQNELAELMIGREVITPTREALSPGEPLLLLDNVSVYGPHERHRLDKVTLAVHKHEIIGIAGVSGNGQKEMARVISGLIHPDEGIINLLGHKLDKANPKEIIQKKVARIPEDRHDSGLFGEMTVWENLISERYREPIFSTAGFLKISSTYNYAKRILKDFDIRCPGPQLPARLLSGGNLQKLILGRVLPYDPLLIVANQPTRGLDIGAVAYVHELLFQARKAGTGIVLISEDLDEIFLLADRIAVIYRGRLTQAFDRESVSVRQIGLLMAGQAEMGKKSET